MIDIIIPAYNCTKTLHRTLSSLEAQSDKNFNVIIVDDCSTEDLMPIIAEKQPHLNIQYIRKDVNEGCGMARQTGIDNAKSDYITFLDSDDILMPYTVELFNSMIQNSDFDVYHSYFYEQLVAPDGTPAIVLYKEGFTWCHGKLYKIDFIKKYGIRNTPKIKYADDSYFNSMCAELGTIGKIPMATYLWMNNNESVTRNAAGGFLNGGAGADFIKAMLLSSEFVLQHKPYVEHLPATINKIQSLYQITPDVQEAYDRLVEISKLQKVDEK
jgi:glycosyltransferase involved in cell wall biosynthesis